MVVVKTDIRVWRTAHDHGRKSLHMVRERKMALGNKAQLKVKKKKKQTNKIKIQNKICPAPSTCRHEANSCPAFKKKKKNP